MGQRRLLRLNEKLVHTKGAIDESDVGERQMNLAEFERLRRSSARTSAALARAREAERVKGARAPPTRPTTSTAFRSFDQARCTPPPWPHGNGHLTTPSAFKGEPPLCGR